MPATWKTIRVFISSTFRDMHAERDYLVKRVFPALRERLEKYRIHLVDIDLRWGITEEEAQKDQVLDLCLSQIDECRPFFIGILGERYGWVPKTFSDEAASKYGWVQYHTGKSVTELEILYGVLRDPKMHGHGMFFFRDPAFIADVPEAKRGDLLAEDRESAEKLAALKQAIRDAHLPFPPFENYPCRFAGLRINWPLVSAELRNNAGEHDALHRVSEDGIVDPREYRRLGDGIRPLVDQFGVVHLAGLEEFGRRVSEQLWQAIQQEHQLPDTPPVVTLTEVDPLAEEAAYHEEFIESRVRVYVGRESVQEQLTAFADGDQTYPCLVTGQSGSGKSAALAQFVRSYAETHPDVLIIPHFVGASPGSTNLQQMLRRFCLVLQDRFGSAEEIPHDVNELASRFRQSLAAVPPNVRMVAVLDALDQLDKSDQAHSLYWLPRELPPHVKLILSCIDDSAAAEPSRETILNQVIHRPLERLTIEPLTDKERRAIMSRVPSISAKKLDDVQVEVLLSNPATENPLYLLVALDELRGFGSFEQVDRRICQLPCPPRAKPQWQHCLAQLRADGQRIPEGDTRQKRLQRLDRFESALEATAPVGDTVVALFGQVIAQLREEFDPDVVQMVLALIACSRHGLSQRELLELVEGIGTEESTSDLFPVLRQLRPYLQHRGELIDFFHRGLYRAAHQRYLPDEESLPGYHAELAGYFLRKLHPPGAEAWSGTYPRSLSELPYHQTRGQLWAELETTLTALQFLAAKTAVGLVFQLAGDFSMAVESLPADRPQRRVLKLLDEALRRDIHFIARHAHDYPQGLFQCLWNTCWWYDCPEAAQHYLPLPANGMGAGAEAGPWSQPVPKLHELLERWRQSKYSVAPVPAWLRSLRPPPMNLGTAQLAVFRGHGRTVASVSYSPDGRLIASGCGNGTVRVWDAGSGAELAVMWRHTNAVTGVSFSPDGRLIASSSYDNTVRVCDASSGAERAVLRGHEKAATGVSFSPDGRWIASSSYDKTVRVWDASSGAELSVLGGHPGRGEVHSVAFDCTGSRFVNACGSLLTDNAIRLWDAHSGAELAALFGHTGEVHAAAFSPGGDRIVSGAHDGTVRLWGADNGAELATLQGHESYVTSVAFSPIGDRIASGSYDNTVRVWDARSGAELAVLHGHEDIVTSVAFSPDGDRIVSGSDDGTVRVWDVHGVAELRILRGHKDYVSHVTFSPDGRRIASIGGDETLRVWDTQTVSDTTISWDEDYMCDVVFSPDGRWIASAGGGFQVRVWDAQSATKAAVLKGHEGEIKSLSFSPDGQLIASGSEDLTVRLWDVASGETVSVSRGHEHEVTSLSFSPGSDRVASAGGLNRTVRIWNVRTGAEVAVLRAETLDIIDHVSFSANGDRIAGESSVGTVHVWDAHTGQCLEVIEGSGDVTVIADGPARFPWRGISRQAETVIERTSDGMPVAWFPESLGRIATHKSGRIWSGADDIRKHLYLITIEGGAGPFGTQVGESRPEDLTHAGRPSNHSRVSQPTATLDMENPFSPTPAVCPPLTDADELPNPLASTAGDHHPATPGANVENLFDLSPFDDDPFGIGVGNRDPFATGKPRADSSEVPAKDNPFGEPSDDDDPFKCDAEPVGGGLERSVLEQTLADPSAELALSYMTQAGAARDRGDHQTALVLYDSAREIYERLVSQEGSVEWKLSLARCHMNLGLCHEELGDHLCAFSQYDQTLLMYQHLVQQERRQDLVGDFAWAQLYRAVIVQKVGRGDEAQEAARQAMMTLESEVRRTGRTDLAQVLQWAQANMAELWP